MHAVLAGVEEVVLVAVLDDMHFSRDWSTNFEMSAENLVQKLPVEHAMLVMSPREFVQLVAVPGFQMARVSNVVVPCPIQRLAPCHLQFSFSSLSASIVILPGKSDASKTCLRTSVLFPMVCQLDFHLHLYVV